MHDPGIGRNTLLHIWILDHHALPVSTSHHEIVESLNLYLNNRAAVHSFSERTLIKECQLKACSCFWQMHFSVCHSGRSVNFCKTVFQQKRSMPGTYSVYIFFYRVWKDLGRRQPDWGKNSEGSSALLVAVEHVGGKPVEKAGAVEPWQLVTFYSLVNHPEKGSQIESTCKRLHPG